MRHCISIRSLSDSKSAAISQLPTCGNIHWPPIICSNERYDLTTLFERFNSPVGPSYTALSLYNLRCVSLLLEMILAAHLCANLKNSSALSTDNNTGLSFANAPNARALKAAQKAYTPLLLLRRIPNAGATAVDYSQASGLSTVARIILKSHLQSLYPASCGWLSSYIQALLGREVIGITLCVDRTPTPTHQSCMQPPTRRKFRQPSKSGRRPPQMPDTKISR